MDTLRIHIQVDDLLFGQIQHAVKACDPLEIVTDLHVGQRLVPQIFDVEDPGTDRACCTAASQFQRFRTNPGSHSFAARLRCCA